MRQYFSLYKAMGNNPINRIDPDGGEDGDPSFCADCLGEGITHFDETADGWAYWIDEGVDTYAVVMDEVIFTPTPLDIVIGLATEATESTVNSLTLIPAGTILPLINQSYIFMKEGIHGGSARDPNNNLSWAKYYKLYNWEFKAYDLDYTPSFSESIGAGTTVVFGVGLKTTGTTILEKTTERGIRIGVKTGINKASEGIEELTGN